METAVPETSARRSPGGCRRAACEASVASTGPPGRPAGSAACAPAELEREADGDAARGAVARTFTWAVSAHAFFPPWAEPRVLCGVSAGLCRWCLWYLVLAVCPWY